jgi:hypothetical protein
MFNRRELLAGCLAVLARPAMADEDAPIAANPKVTFAGVITQVNLSPGNGPSSLQVERDGKPVTVFLGPLRYLIAQNFSPKAGQPVSVRGYESGNSVVAIEVTLTQEDKTLKLRDAEGRPLWRGGWHGTSKKGNS